MKDNKYDMIDILRTGINRCNKSYFQNWLSLSGSRSVCLRPYAFPRKLPSQTSYPRSWRTKARLVRPCVTQQAELQRRPCVDNVDVTSVDSVDITFLDITRLDSGQVV